MNISYHVNRPQQMRRSKKIYQQLKINERRQKRFTTENIKNAPGANKKHPEFVKFSPVQNSLLITLFCQKFRPQNRFLNHRNKSSLSKSRQKSNLSQCINWKDTTLINNIHKIVTSIL